MTNPSRNFVHLLRSVETLTRIGNKPGAAAMIEAAEGQVAASEVGMCTKCVQRRTRQLEALGKPRPGFAMARRTAKSNTQESPGESTRRKVKHPCGGRPWEPLRELRRRLIAQQTHPIYVARGNEHPLLQHLVAQDRVKKSVQRGDENGHA